MQHLAKKISSIFKSKKIDAEARPASVAQALKDAHPADISDLIEDLDENLREAFFRISANLIDSRVLFHLEPSRRREVILFFGSEHFQASIHMLNVEKLRKLIMELDEENQKSFLNMVPKKYEKPLNELLEYPEDSVGQSMSFSFVSIPELWTIADALQYMRLLENAPEHCAEIFLQDKNNRLIRADSQLKLKDIKNSAVISIKATDDQEITYDLFNKYHFTSLPVVDENNQMIGIIKADDMINIVREELSEDFTQFAGTDEEIDAPLLTSCFNRLRWLSLIIVNTMLSPFIISLFQNTIHQYVHLAVLMPIVGALGGSIGIQTASVIIKALSINSIREEQYAKAVRKEALTGFLNGIAIGIILGTITLLWFQEPKLSLILCSAMIFCATWASLIGVLIPLAFDKFGYDSSISSGPLITTIADMSGYVIFLGLAAITLGKI